MLYSRSLLVIYFKYSNVFMPIPNSLNVPHPHPSSLDFITTWEHLGDAAHIQDVSDSMAWRHTSGDIVEAWMLRG